ncbi:MAG TPA: hypothetical protein VG795_16530 [Acidimicrobiia bacterium]|nr:hypothetical protein [Acidimicrobiia bacterium]
MRARHCVLIAVVLVLASVGVVPAAAQQQGTRCTAEYVVNLSPGLGSEPVSGVFHSDGESGTIDCQRQRGTFGGDGRYGTKEPITCTSGGEGWGVHSFTIDGSNIKNTFTMKIGKISDRHQFEGDRLSGTFTVTPVEGDCVTKPATSVRVQIEGLLEN